MHPPYPRVDWRVNDTGGEPGGSQWERTSTPAPHSTPAASVHPCISFTFTSSPDKWTAHFSLPSASKYTIANVFKNHIRKANCIKVVSTFLVVFGRESSPTHLKALLQGGSWGTIHSAHGNRRSRGRQEPLTSQTWPRLCQDGEGKKGKWLTSCRIPIQKEKKISLNHLSLSLILHVWEYQI